MKIILGSQSKGRRQMLEKMGFEFEVMPADIDEKAIRRVKPEELVAAIARAKAEALIGKITEPALLITSDQVVVCAGIILEKPKDEREARSFLQRYNSSPAQTVTAVVVTDTTTGRSQVGVDVAQIYFRPFLEEEISHLVAAGEVFHAAGGFLIDGQGWADHIERIEGDRDSVIGLPQTLTARLLQEVGGVSWPSEK